MDTSLLNHVILFLLASSVSAAPPEQKQQVDDEDVLHVIRCRSICLDEFSGVLRTEGHCQTEKECKMCWDACGLLHTSFKIWGPMCTVQDICFPGCQKACSTVTTGRDIGREVDSSISLHSLYDPQTDKVTVEWNHPKDTEAQGSVLYAVLLREKNGNYQEWEELTQTTSHIIQVKRGLLGRDTDIRLVAANATGQITDTVTSYLDSLVAEPENSISSSIDYEEEEDENVPQIIHRSGRWRPHLLSIRQTHKSLGVQATVTWPLIRSPGAAKYEVSWNVIDDTIEITGHLQTSSNVAVLTLWPNALYSVQINAYVDNEDPVTKSEPLVIDTRLEKPAMSVSSAPLQCRDNQDILIGSLFVIVIFVTFVLIVACCCRCTMSRKSKSSCIDENICSNEAYSTKNSIGKLPVSRSMSLQGPHSPVGESREQLLNCNIHGSPYMTTTRPLHTHIDLGNAL